MATRDELLSQCRAETRPGLLNPSPEHPALLKNINEYLLCRAAVEELRLEGEFPEVESDALELTVEAFDEFMGESMKSMGDLMNLVDEISRARSLNYVFPGLKVEGGSAST